jgi:hypothetical protein
LEQSLAPNFNRQQLQNLSAYPEDYFYSQGYLDLPAFRKSDALWTNIIADTTSNSWPGIKLAEIFLESMEPTIQWPGDTF